MTALATLWPDLARGSAPGLAVAAPIGPTALLCIKGTLAAAAPAQTVPIISLSDKLRTQPVGLATLIG